MVHRKISRREFAEAVGLVAVTAMLPVPSLARYSQKYTIKAIAFDGFPIFDPRPIFAAVAELFPEKGKQIIEIWKSKQFSYQWLRVSAHKYKNFWDVTIDALEFALTQCNVELTEADKTLIMGKYKAITLWPDVIPALQSLKRENLKLCFLSNMTAEMLNQGLRNAKIEGFFDHVISTDQKETYKPSPDAYQMGVDVLQLKKEEILFVAFAGWDMAGAKWFGYPTFWVNRLGAPIDRLDAEPDGMGSGLNDVVEFVKEYNKDKDKE